MLRFDRIFNSKARAGFFRELRRYCNCRSGLAATEFSLVTTFFLFPVFFGTLEASQLILSNRRLTTASNSIVDIISQAENVSRDDVDALIDSTADLLGEDNLNNISVKVYSIVRDPDDDQVLRVHWARDNHGDESETGQIYTGISDIERVHTASTVLVVEMEHTHTSGITDKIFQTPFTFTRTSIRWPRQSFEVQLCDDVEKNTACSESAFS